MASALDRVGGQRQLRTNLYPEGYVPKHHRAAGTQAGDMTPLEAGALLTMPAPIVGDIMGLAADAEMYKTKPESRHWLNYLLTGLGALPFVPPAAAIFAGPGAKTANMGMLNKAKQMAEAGADRRQVWDETGWFQGADGAWRFEISDQAMDFQPTYYEPQYDAMVRAHTAGGAYHHPDLFKAYPDAQTITMGRSAPAGGGNYYRQPESISVGDHPLLRRRFDVAAHEMQHAVQAREGFARGGSPNFGHSVDDITRAAREAYEEAAGDTQLLADLGIAASDVPAASRPDWDQLSHRDQVKWFEEGRNRLYRRLAGEVEARNVETRRPWSAEQRRQFPPWETEDIPREEQIFRWYDAPAQSLPMDEASRMQRAREMGFTVDAFKGMPSHSGGPTIHGGTGEVLVDAPWEEITEINTPGTHLGGQYAGFFSDDPSVASRFVEWKGDERAMVVPAKLRMAHPATIDMRGRPAAAAQFESAAGADRAALEQMRAALADDAFDAVILQNTADEGNVYVPKSPQQVRSRFAKFDPAKKESRDLLAGVGGATAGAAGTATLGAIGGQRRKQYNEEDEGGT